MAITNVNQWRFFRTPFGGMRTACVEPTALWRVCRTWHITIKRNAIRTVLLKYLRRCGKQSPGIRMLRVCKQRFGSRHFHDLSQVHHNYSVADMLHNAKIMADEQIGEAELFLQITQQVKNLRTNRHIKRRNRFITDYEIRVRCKRSRDYDTLPLTA